MDLEEEINAIDTRFENLENLVLTRDSLEEIFNECLNRYDHPGEYKIESDPGRDPSMFVTDPHCRHHEMQEKLIFIEGKIDNLVEKLDSLEEKLDSLELNMSPLLDLLNTLIKNNISVETLEEEPKQTEQKPELAYRVNEDNIYIYGTKTYDNRGLIKSAFKNASWSKENNAWTFKVFDNYEDTLTKLFPNIIKGQ